MVLLHLTITSQVLLTILSFNHKTRCPSLLWFFLRICTKLILMFSHKFDLPSMQFYMVYLLQSSTCQGRRGIVQLWVFLLSTRQPTPSMVSSSFELSSGVVQPQGGSGMSRFQWRWCRLLLCTEQSLDVHPRLAGSGRYKFQSSNHLRHSLLLRTSMNGELTL